MAWLFAIYPLIIIGAFLYVVIRGISISVELAGLFIGLLTAASIRTGLKQGKKNNDSSDNNDDDGVLRFGKEQLESDSGSGTDDFNGLAFVFVDVFGDNVYNI